MPWALIAEQPLHICPSPRTITTVANPQTRLFSTISNLLTKPNPPSNNNDNDDNDDINSANSANTSPTTQSLPHLTPTGTAHMVGVTVKRATHRRAIATGRVVFSNASPARLIGRNALRKGDVLAVARVAGIMAAKRTPDVVPLCHPIALGRVAVDVKVVGGIGEGEGEEDGGDGAIEREEGGEGGKAVRMPFGAVVIEATVECVGPTGVEMEALVAVMGAAATVVDMCKAVDRGMVVGDVRVVLKEGGRSGTWREEGWASAFGPEDG